MSACWPTKALIYDVLSKSEKKMLLILVMSIKMSYDHFNSSLTLFCSLLRVVESDFFEVK